MRRQLVVLLRLRALGGARAVADEAERRAQELAVAQVQPRLPLELDLGASGSVRAWTSGEGMI